MWSANKSSETKNEDYNQFLKEEKLDNDTTNLFQELLQLTIEHDSSSCSAMMLCDVFINNLLVFTNHEQYFLC